MDVEEEEEEEGEHWVDEALGTPDGSDGAESAADDAAGGPADELRRVADVLGAIFEYYCVQRQEPHLTSARFQRMAMDSCLVGPRLSSAQVDVTFSHVCGLSPHMTLPQFRDAMVRIAALKFPELPSSEAVLRMHQEHLSAFDANSTSTGAFGELLPEVVVVLATVRPSLQVLYEGYFAHETTRLVPQRSTATALSEAQASFLQMLTDFEIIPDLCTKAAAHAIFREVSKVRAVPDSFWQQLLGDEDAAAPSAKTRYGRLFTFAHFAAALARAGARCFANDGHTALRRLLEWMDASKGRVVFASSCPGVLAAGAALRLAPATALDKAVAGFANGQSSALSSARRSSARSPDIVDMSPGVSSVGGSSPSTPPPVQLQGLPRDSGKDARARASATRDAQVSAVQGLSGQLRRQAQHIYQHYVALGDPLARSGLGSMKFTRFLRDAGLVSTEVSIPATPAFAPPSRLSPTSGRSFGAGQRSASMGNVAARPSLASSATPRSGLRGSPGGARASVRRSVQYSTSPTGIGFDDSALPLRLFVRPPLTSVDADLVFVQALRAQEAEAQRRAGAVRRPGQTRPEPAAKGRFLDFGGFCRALSDIAERCAPELLATAESAASSTTEEDGRALDRFCECVLAPLCSALGGDRNEDQQRALQDFADAECGDLLCRNEAALERIFRAFSADRGGLVYRWAAGSFSKFAEEFGIAAELSNLQLQRMLRDCSRHERGEDGDDEGDAAGSPPAAAPDIAEISISGFRLLLVMLSQKLGISAGGERPVDRLALLFSNFNSVAGTPSFATRFGPQRGPFFQVPKPSKPSRSASAPRFTDRRTSTGSAASCGTGCLGHGLGLPIGSGGARGGKRPSVDNSWDALLSAAAASASPSR